MIRWSVLNVRWFELQTTLLLEIVTRAFLSLVFLELEQASPFIRKIHLDEIWLYKNPPTSSYVPTNILFSLVFLVPTTALLLHFICRRNKIELCQGLLSLSLALCLNGVITNTIKVVVGRPRPDFFYRCFPDGKIDLEAVTDISQACKGEEATVIEGRKSFPSGHASFSFCSLGFLTLWLCGKLGVFRGSRSEGWKLVFAGSPLIVALIIALSRTCDYHHHWQDVFVGGLIGSLVSYLCYRQYYPRLSAPCCNLPYLLLPKFRRSHQESTFDVTTLANGRASSDMAFCDPESPMEEQVKWT